MGSETMRRAVREAESRLGVSLPADYVAFLAGVIGEEAAIGGSQLWPVGELVWHNEGYRVEEFAPGLVMFGTDGGLEAYGFDTRSGGTPPVVMVPFVPMNWEAAVPCGRTFSEFLETPRRGGGCFSLRDNENE